MDIENGILQINPPIPPINENIPNWFIKEMSPAPKDAPRIGIIKVRKDIRVVFMRELLNILNIINDAMIGLSRRIKNSGKLSSESIVNNFWIITKNIPVRDPERIPKLKNKNIWFLLLFDLLMGFWSLEKYESKNKDYCDNKLWDDHYC